MECHGSFWGFLSRLGIFSEFLLLQIYMGQFLQDGEDEENLAFFFEKIEALLWLNVLIFSNFLNFSEEIMSLGA